LREERFGGIEVLVNNAGYGYRAAVEEGDDKEVEDLFATKFFGAVSMIKAVLPGCGRDALPPSSASPRSPAGWRHRDPATGRRRGASCTDFAGRSLPQTKATIDD
jgi:NAD(P)-dependent dehydrogenase (short-subunit alcohol dehydrogenase family)